MAGRVVWEEIAWHGMAWHALEWAWYRICIMTRRSPLKATVQR